MDRRQYGDSFFARAVHGSSCYSPTRQRMTEDELVARSKEWINRQERDRGDPWKRSVDDFLDDRTERPSGRYRRSRDRDRGSRDRSTTRSRSRSRERDSRKEKRRDRSRERDRGSRRWTPEDDDRDHDGSRRHGGGRREERKERHGRYDERHSSKKSAKEDDDDNKHWSSGDEENSNGKSDQEYDYRSYPSYTSDNTLRPEDRFAYKKQTPQRTIIIRGLAQHITEQDIQEDILLCNLTCRDIRLVRRKHTGTSRGFAFVEFRSVEDATKWIESKQGELMLKDHFRALLQYSLPKDSNSKDKWLSDWYCKCQAHNFRRRETCFKCNLSRSEGETAEGMDQVSAHPTNTVLLRGLDALTTEENVLQSIKTLSSLPIRSVRIGRDAATNASRGVCYLEMNNVVDAMYLYNALQTSPPLVDGKTPAVSYAKLDPLTMHSPSTSGQIANVALAAAQWSHQKNEAQYKLSDVPRLAEQSAAMYATNPQEKTAYVAYYEDYYRKQIASGEQVNLPVNNTSGLATAQAAMAAHKKSKEAPKVPLTETPDGSGMATYPAPDVTTYQYDSSSGYYYDPYTTLYYDATSQYYYNNKLRKFLYWDATRKTYLPAPTSTPQPVNTQAAVTAAATATTISADPVTSEPVKEDDSKKGKEKESEKDKVKVAKRIAKDMERWAKTLNQKKEIAKQNITAATAAMTSLKAAGAADIGYAVLERKDLSLPAIGNGVNPRTASNESLVAAYGQGSDSDEEDESAQEDKLHTDWAKLACLLCKRQFPSKDALMKHQQLSDLHRQNLSAWYKSKGLDPDDAQNRRRQYRDRARERRMKYGEPDAPPTSKLKESYMKAREAVSSYEEPTKEGIGADNLGNKLLQKMGWQEGMGLGKKNQGRTSIIQAERRSATAGLGTKHVGVTPGPGETYKDCVKKMMQIRYSEINDQS